MKATTPTKSQMKRAIFGIVGISDNSELLTDSVIQLQFNIEKATASDEREIKVKKSLAIKRN